jgi:hypothetical protein
MNIGLRLNIEDTGKPLKLQGRSPCAVDSRRTCAIQSSLSFHADAGTLSLLRVAGQLLVVVSDCD